MNTEKNQICASKIRAAADQKAIDKFLKEKGVTKCPAASARGVSRK